MTRSDAATERSADSRITPEQSTRSTGILVHEPIMPTIGSRIVNDKAALLSGDLADEISALLEQRGVLVFPGIGFTDEEQITFTKTLGQFSPDGAGDGEGGESVSRITLDRREGPLMAEFLRGSLFWHIDGTASEVPLLASLLSCKVPAPSGGNTGFCNTYAAYDALDDGSKARYADMRVVHAPWASLFCYDPEPSLAKLTLLQSLGEQELPLVWTHRSGRRSLIVGCTALHIVGVNRAESAAILTGLREWATSSAFSYSHRWRAGDLVMWDNTGTMHRAEAYDPECGRLMLRTKVAGVERFA